MKHDPSFEALVNEIKPLIKECTISDVQERLSTNKLFKLIDVREDHEWSVDRIPHSIHLGRGIIERDIASLVEDKSEEIILYCGGGFRSALAAYNLQKMGYSNVYSLIGGIRLWREQVGL